MNPLFETYSLLAEGMRADPLLCLAAATVWLDPMWAAADIWDDEPDEITMALMVTRQSFPDLYAETVELLRLNASYRDIEHLVCQGFSRRGIPLDNLEMLTFGIPLQSAGIELGDPQTHEIYPELLPLLKLFGFTPDLEEYSITVPEEVYVAARLLSEYLVEQEDERSKQIGWMLAWTFSCSGNSLIDFDDETLAEIPPLTWEQNDLDFAIELIREADDIMGYVRAGFDLLEENSVVLQTLATNINRVMKGNKHVARLEWTAFNDSTTGAALVGAEFLQLRGDAA